MMSDAQPAKILARIAAEDFVGREDEADEFWRIATGDAASQGILLLSAPGAGASELLRQTYDRIFNECQDVIPFYFAFSNNDKTVRQAAARFLRSFFSRPSLFAVKIRNFFRLRPTFARFPSLPRRLTRIGFSH